MLAVLAALAGTADAKRIAVLDIEGGRDDGLDRELASIVASRHEVVTAGEYRRTATALRAERLRRWDIARVADRIAVNGVLHGRFEPEGPRYVLRLRLRDGRTGKIARRLTVKLNGPRLTPAVLDPLRQSLLAAIEELPELPRNRTVASRPPPETGPARPPGTGRGAVLRPAGDTGTGGAPRRPAGEEALPAAVTTVPPGEEPGDPRDSRVVMSAGVGAFRRQLSFDVRSGLTQRPSNYRSTFVPSLRAEGQLFPLARSGSLIGKFGAGFTVSRALSLSSSVPDSPDLKLDTEFTEYGASLLLRHHFGASRGPSLVIGVGYHRLRFQLDKSTLPSTVRDPFPSTAYTFIDPGLALRIPLGGRAHLAARASFLAVLAAGEIQDKSWYGTATVFGTDADAGLAVNLSRTLQLSAGAHFTGMLYDFRGNGEFSGNLDGDFSTVDVDSALDHYLNFYLAAGFVL